MEKADSLSRRPDWKIEVKKNNKNEMLVKPKWLEARRTENVMIDLIVSMCFTHGLLLFHTTSYI